MAFVATILPYVQVALSLALIVAILLQQRGSSVGGAFGADNMGTTFYTRRGAEKMLFRTTFVLGVLFALSSFVTLFV